MRRALISKDLDRRAAFKRAQTRGVGVRSPMRGTLRDPMRDIDLMALGDVGASTPLPSTTREHRIQFASRTREPASRLLPLMARPPNFEAEFVFKYFCTLCATLCAGPFPKI